MTFSALSFLSLVFGPSHRTRTCSTWPGTLINSNSFTWWRTNGTPQPSNEVHYAELALAIPHDDNSNKNHLNHLKKLPPPPAYNYFDEPTIYAQIDHGGTNYKTSSTSPFPLISPVSQQQQQQQPTTPLQLQSLNQSQLTLQLPTDHHSSSGSSHSQQQQHTPTSLQNHTPTSLQQQHHQMHQAPPPPAPQPLQLPNNNKQYLREIVTVRTPLAFSQQESCV